MTTPVENSPERDWIEHEMLAAHGTGNQLERWEAGLLPDSELLAVARDVLFAPFASFDRWAKLEASDMRHERTCASWGPPSVSFSTKPPKDLTNDEWSNFKKLTVAVSQANNDALAKYKVTATVSLVEHVGRCISCSAEVYGRAANIRIEWAGRPLSREYALES